MEKQFNHIGDGVYTANAGFEFIISVNDHNNPVVFIDRDIAKKLIKELQEFVRY